VLTLPTHADEEQAMTGVWVVDEVRKAVEKGYRVLEKHEVWEYEVVMYDPEKKEDVFLLSPNISTFMKVKTECNGWPAGCDTEE